MPPVRGKMWDYPQENLLAAVEAVKCGRMKIGEAAVKYGVPRTNLIYKVAGKTPLERKMGPASVLCRDEEEVLVQWIQVMARAGFPVSYAHLQNSVQRIAEDEQRKNPFTDNLPGKKWVESFLNRNPTVSTRVAENLTRSRAAVTAGQVLSWFKEVETNLKEDSFFDILEDSERTFNRDETAFFLNPKGKRVLAPKGCKSVYLNVNSDDKECLTVLITASAAGVMAPPMVVFKYDCIPQKVAQSVPKHWGMGKSDNGRMTQATFYEYIANVFHPWLLKNKYKLPVIYFLDGHTSHLTLHLSEFCKQNGIVLIALYPNTTHFLQPMDVAVFRALKEEWKNRVHEWRLQHLDAPFLQKTDFCELVDEVLRKKLTVTTVANGFRKCGLHPWNPYAVESVKNSLSSPTTRLENCDAQRANTAAVNQALTVLDNFIGPQRIISFRSCESSVWNGSVQDTSLFEIWKEMTPSR